MSTLFTSVILTMALLTPNLAKESQKTTTMPLLVPTETVASGALQAPKTAFLTLGEYAEHTAIEAGIDPIKFRRLITCESQWKEDAAGDQGTSLGLLQFKKPTFSHFTKKYNITDADMDDPRHQIDLAATMIAGGYLHHWKNCSRKIGWSDKI